MSGIKIEINADDTLTDLITELKEFAPKRLPRLIVREVLPPAQRYLDQQVNTRLRAYPPRRDKSRPFVWSFDKRKNERARRWFFANYPNGYTRTGALGRAWEGDVTYAKSGEISVYVANDTRGASYVYGAEQFNYKQVPGHVTTGWLNAGDDGADVVTDVAVFVNNRLEEVITDELRKL